MRTFSLLPYLETPINIVVNSDMGGLRATILISPEPSNMKFNHFLKSCEFDLIAWQLWMTILKTELVENYA